jgi:hypothetical protein
VYTKPLPEMTQKQEDVAKEAILDNVMKGRITPDLMLRCEYPTHCMWDLVSHISILGTVLNAEGTLAPSLRTSDSSIKARQRKDHLWAIQKVGSLHRTWPERE